MSKPSKQQLAEIFTIWSNEVSDRIDPYFHLPKFKELYKKINSYKKVVRLKDIVDELDYGLMPTQDYAETEAEGVPMIRVTNIMQDGTIDMSDVQYIPFNTPRLDVKRVRKDDILMVQCGSTTGKVALVPKELENYTFGSFSFVIRGKSNLVTQEYLFAILISPLIQEQIRQTWNIVTVRPNTSKPSVENLLIPLPSLVEQKKIGQKLLEAYGEKRKKEEEIKTILASIDNFVLGELGIETERERGRESKRARANLANLERRD